MMQSPRAVVVSPSKQWCPEVICAWLRNIFQSAGLSNDDSDAVARNLTEAEVRGVSSHGLILVPVYVQRIRSGGIRRRYTMRVVRDRGAALLLDGGGGPGQSLAFRATELAIVGARRFGIYHVGLRNSNHVGMLASYALRAAEAGLIGIVQTNSGPSVSPARGSKRLLGNNALCLAAPCGDSPLVIDMATGMVACGKVRIAAMNGEALPAAWILNANGEASTNPAELDTGGCVRPSGDHKGYALAVWIDIISALLAGGPPSYELQNQRRAPDAPTGASQSVCTIDPEYFIGRMALETSIAAYRNVLHRAPPTDSVLPVLAPGDPELQAMRNAQNEGIIISKHILHTLNAVAKELGTRPFPV